MNRTQVTHVRKFDGVWYQLIINRGGEEGCLYCPFGPGECKEPQHFDCTIFEDSWNREDSWKEIGPK